MPDLHLAVLYEALRAFTAGQPPQMQWCVVLLGGALPFVESYYASVIGIVAGVDPVAAAVSAITGNIASTSGCIAVATLVRRRRSHPCPGSVDQVACDAAVIGTRIRNPTLRRRFERYGIPGVCLSSQAVLPSQITAVALVLVGAPSRQIAMWQCLSIAVWGAGYACLAVLGVGLLV